MADGSSFKRYEKKYLITQSEYEKFYPKLLAYMEEDEYGLSTICNIYYDTPTFRLIRESLEKPVYKEKLRLRSYGVPSDTTKAFVELKKKYDGIVYKRRTSLPYGEAHDWLTMKEERGKDQIGREIDYVLHFYEGIQASCVLCYDRIALYGKEDASIRVTLDKNIRWRTDDLDLRLGDHGEMLFDEPLYLVEIKVPGNMPRWMIDLFNDLQIYPTSFSKYGKVYRVFESVEDFG